MKKYTWLFFFLLIACGESPTEGESPVLKVSLDKIEKKNNPFQYSHFITLSIPEEIVIGDFNKLQIIDDILYMSDRQSSSLIAFDNSGLYLWHLNKRGSGPEEYTKLADFEVNHNGIIHILDDIGGKMLRYDHQGFFLGSWPAPRAESFKLLNDGIIAYNLANGSSREAEFYNYEVIKDGEQLLLKDIVFHKELAGRQYHFPNGNYSFHVSKGEVYTTFFMDDTVYHIDSDTGKLTPYISFGFNTQRPSSKSPPRMAIDYFDSMVAGKEVTSPFNFYKHEDTVSAMFLYDQKYFMVIGNHYGEVYQYGVIDFNEYGLPFRPLSYLDGDGNGYIPTVINSHNLPLFIRLCNEKGLDSSVLDEIKAAVGNSDNPTLIFYLPQ